MQIIGTLTVRRGDVVLHAHQLGGPKPRQILEILLLQLGIPVSKDTLIGLLWGDRPPAAALATLESYVSVLRRNLQPGAAREGPLRTSTGGYVLERSLVDLDLYRFNTLVAAAERSAPAEGYELLCRALGLATAPLLGDELLAGWAEDERSFHTGRVTSATILAAETAAELGRPDEAVRWARQALVPDPLNERAWTILMLSLEQANRQAEGLHAYERCRRAMNRELGCLPGPVLRAAYARLLQATADSESELSDVLAALLILNDQLRGTTGSRAEPTSMSPDPPAPDPPAPEPPGRNSLRRNAPLRAAPATDSLREAGKVVDSFLRRALANA